MIFLSDIHSHWPRALADIRGHVIIGGDSLDDGAGFELDMAARALEPLAGRITLAVGNHDQGLRGLFYNPHSARRFDDLSARLQGHRWMDKQPMVQQVREGGVDVSIITLNSCAQTVKWNDYARGEIGREQLAELDRILSVTRGLKVVVLHHHPFMKSATMNLIDAGYLMMFLRNRADALLFGHRHEAGRYDGAQGIPLVIAAGAGWLSPQVDEIYVENGRLAARKVTLGGI